MRSSRWKGDKDIMAVNTSNLSEALKQMYTQELILRMQLNAPVASLIRKPKKANLKRKKKSHLLL